MAELTIEEVLKKYHDDGFPLPKEDIFLALQGIARPELMGLVGACFERSRSTQALSEACEAAQSHILELEDAWLRGCITENDGQGGTRSNRNIEVRNVIRAALAKFRKGQP